jgi:hypothetical protein
MPWLPAAFFGALIGVVAGLGAEAIVDPSGNREATYADSTRMLFVLRYVGFGLIVGVAVWLLAERSRRPRSLSAGSALAAGLALVLVAAAGIYPVVHDSSPAAPANAREVFLNNCQKLTGQDKSVSASEASRYCGCLVTTFERDRTGDDLRRFLTDVNRSLSEGTAPPAGAVSASEICTKKVGLR